MEYIKKENDGDELSNIIIIMIAYIMRHTSNEYNDIPMDQLCEMLQSGEYGIRIQVFRNVESDHNVKS